MVVYLEYVLLDNIVITALLLWLTFRTVKLRHSRLGILLGALVGTVFAFVLPLVQLGGVLMFLIKLFIGAVVVFTAMSLKPRKAPGGRISFARFLLFYVVFVALTFAFGGAIYGIAFAFTGTANSLTYFSQNLSVPVGVFVAAAIAIAWLLHLLVKFLNMRHSINTCLRDVVITYKDEKFRVTSYYDTGNRLIDPKSRAPVVIITLSLFLKMFPDVALEHVFLNRLASAEIDDGHYINFSTVDSNGKMFVFAPSRLDVHEGRTIKTHENVRLGVSLKGFKSKFDALLNANLT